MSHVTGGQIAMFAALGFAIAVCCFVLFWALAGWGMAIAVRSYRYAMRAQPAQVAVVDRARRELV